MDGACLRHVKKELEEQLLGARVDKIHQPNKEELVFLFRTRESGPLRLLISARANSARVHLTAVAVENPKQPPMLCMLLRKKLSGAKLLTIRQPELERLLHFDFDSVNELGDHVTLTLTTEIMGRYSNVILSDENGKIIDALKRVDAEMSSQRLVLPGVTYHLPPAQEKLCLLDTSSQEIVQAVKNLPSDAALSKALLTVLQGLSPVVCRELEHQVGRGTELNIRQMEEEQYFRLGFFCQKLKDMVETVSGEPFLVTDRRKKPMDLSFLEVWQYGTAAVVSKEERFSALLDKFYAQRDQIDRMRVKSQDILRVLTNHSERLSRKINAQKEELLQCARREELRVAGDLINANLYAIEKGADYVTLSNFYEEGTPLLEIRLDPALTAVQNAQKYYKEYRKAKTAEEKLSQQITLAQEEMVYLESVFDALSRAETEQELTEIRTELAEQGYVRIPRGKREKPAPISAPMKFETKDGFVIWVGRNNRQNDRLTMKLAGNNDIWFHTKNIPGSHTVLVTEGKTPSEEALLEAAVLAARYSKARDSAQVPVDYTQVRHVSKPQGAKPGMVIYENYKTAFVNPN